MFNVMTKGYIAAYLGLKGFLKDQRGITAIEYALIGVAVASLLALVLGNGESTGFLFELKQAFQKIQAAILSVTSTKP
ncbi:Flp family type IVb pilin [Budvicia diplopodorum]|uniref:Flp family type IVb pilin n=1 Tax=Budvicia diplopodorum TaxID=1119056 RepID=UPI00135C7033|nr:Flp family type IVb pilin [Budvicia diplopodorum]